MLDADDAAGKLVHTAPVGLSSLGPVAGHAFVAEAEPKRRTDGVDAQSAEGGNGIARDDGR